MSAPSTIIENFDSDIAGASERQTSAAAKTSRSDTTGISSTDLQKLIDKNQSL